MYVDKTAPQCWLKCPQNACDHHMDDCFVYAKKIAWPMVPLSEGREHSHYGSGLPCCHDLMPCSRVSKMGLGVLNVNLSVVFTVPHCWSQMVWPWGKYKTRL